MLGRLLLCFCMLLPGIALANQRPNIVWIVLDDLGPEVGCYGFENVSTPAIDRLAAEGVRYTNCFATSPVCSSSRSALVTGMYQTSTGTHHHRTRNKVPLVDGAQTAMQQFGEAGYFVCDAGPPGETGNAKRDYNFSDSDHLFHGKDWSERRPGQPFFAQIQIHQPHRPFVHDTDPDRAALVGLPPKVPDHPVARADMANYLATIEVGDQHVDAVMKRLEAEGLRDTTWVILFGDHGRPHVWGKQWLYDAGIRVPMIVAGPGIAAPGTTDARLVSLIDLAPTSLLTAGITPHARTQGVNFLAEDFSGREFIVAARDRCGEAADRIRALRTERLKYIRNFYLDRPYTQISSYKTLSYPVVTLLEVLHSRGELTPPAAAMMAETRPAEELYDLQSDPDELHNLVDSSTHRETLEGFRQKLAGWIESTQDLGAQAEGDAAYQAAIVTEKRVWYEKTQLKRGLDPNGSAADYLDWWRKELRLDVPQ